MDNFRTHPDILQKITNDGLLENFQVFQKLALRFWVVLVDFSFQDQCQTSVVLNWHNRRSITYNHCAIMLQTGIAALADNAYVNRNLNPNLTMSSSYYAYFAGCFK